MINNKRLLEIEQEIYRRLKLWLKNSTWDEMTTEGSLIRFNMSLGMIGYPFEKSYEWMKNEKNNRFNKETKLFIYYYRDYFNSYCRQF